MSCDAPTAATAPRPIDDHPLQRQRRARELRLERADDEQPEQHAGQRDARAGGREREPGRERRRAEDHADRHRAVHEQQRAQDDADVADVERRFRAASARGRFRRDDVEDRRAEAGRARRRFAGSGAGGRRDQGHAHRRRNGADRIARILAWHMLGIVANRRPAVGPMLRARRRRSVRIPTLGATRQLRDTCPRTSSRRNPRPGRRCSPSRRASS